MTHPTVGGGLTPNSPMDGWCWAPGHNNITTVSVTTTQEERVGGCNYYYCDLFVCLPAISLSLQHIN